ncbi:MAG: hypothetical protein OHK0046_48500 [Anaerolineae bacterium]
MKARIRPEQVNSALNSVGTDHENTTGLEMYRAGLETNPPDRPTRIISLLQDVEACCSTEAKVSLEAYITQLEANQLVAAAPDDLPDLWFDRENPPRWSHQRSLEREQRQRVRALRKHNNYR